MSFHSPWLFLSLLALFALFFKQQKKGRLLYSQLKTLKRMSPSVKVRLRKLPFFLKLLGLSLIIVALARPRELDTASYQNKKGIDILLVLDISKSMLVPDMGEGLTRLEAARQVMRDFIKGRLSDRMGLIVFSGESYALSPLTLDYDFLLSKLESVTSAENIKQGTAIGVALSSAAARMRHSPLDSRVLVFLTDGENNRGFIDPLTALNFLKDENIRIYTIGVARVSGRAPIRVPIQDALGRKGFRRTYIDTNINEDLLKEMARQTKGKFFRARDLFSLKSVFSEIDSLEKQNIPDEKWHTYKEFFIYPLMAGWIAYVWGLVLSLTVFFRGV